MVRLMLGCYRLLKLFNWDKSKQPSEGLGDDHSVGGVVTDMTGINEVTALDDITKDDFQNG